MNDEATASTLPAPPDDDPWPTFPLVGYQDDGEGGWLELRNRGQYTFSRPVLCRCGCRATAKCDGGVFLCAGCERSWHLGVQL